MTPDPIRDAMTRYYRDRYSGHPVAFVLGVVVALVVVLSLI